MPRVVPKLVETIRVVVGEQLDQHLASDREGISWDAEAAAGSTVDGRLPLQLYLHSASCKILYFCVILNVIE